MNHIKSLLTIAALSMATFVFAQTTTVEELHERYMTLIEDEVPDTAALRGLLQDWEKVAPKDPDIYAVRYDFERVNRMKDPNSLDQTGDNYLPGTFDKAIQILDEAIGKYPNRLDFQLNRVIGLALNHNNDKALASIMQIIDKTKENPDSWMWLLNKPLENGFEDFEEKMTAVFDTFMGTNDFQGAEIISASLLSAFPQSFPFRAQHASLQAASENFEQAIEEFLLLEKEQPQSEYCLRYLAQLYAVTGNEEKTREYCGKLVAVNDLYAGIANMLIGTFDTVTVDFDEIKEYMKTHEEEYRHIELRFKTGTSDMSLRDLSILYFGHALTKECTSTKLWDIDPDSLLKNEKYEELLKACEETLKLHPASIAANFYAGLAADELGQFVAGLYFLKCEQLKRMILKSADGVNNIAGTKGEEAEPKEKTGKDHIYYKILWRADEDVFVDYLLAPEEKQGTLFFSQPVYFLDKDFK